MARGGLVSRRPPAPSFSSNRKNLRRFYYCAARPGNGRDASELLRLFSPNKSRGSRAPERNREELPASVSCCIEEDVLEVIRDDYGQAYFLTGHQVKESHSAPKPNNPHRPSTNPIIINKSSQSQPLFAASFQQLLKMSENENPTPLPSPSPAQSWPSVDPDPTVICIGDIHGYFSKLLRLWSNLQSAVPPAAFDTSLVIFLGDYCDRGPQTRQVLDFLIGLPAKYPRQRHVFLCGNHDLAFAAFVGALPARADGAARWDDTWEEYAQSEEREGWYKGEGYAEMHVQGRRWAGTVNRFNAKKGMAYKGSIYDSAPTFESYGVPHASPDLIKAVPDEHKKFLRDLVWVHEEENVAIDTEKGRMNCRLIAVHAGLEKAKEVQERLQVLRDRDSSLHTVQELRGRMNVWDIPKDLSENPTILVSGHHGKLHIDGLRFIIDESGGLEHLPIAAIIFPSQKIVRDNDS